MWCQPSIYTRKTFPHFITLKQTQSGSGISFSIFFKIKSKKSDIIFISFAQLEKNKHNVFIYM